VSIHLSVQLLAIVVFVIVIGLVFTRRRATAWESERRDRTEPPPLPRRHPPTDEPSVRIGRLLIAIFLFPFVLFFWALASLGDLVEAAVHLALAGVSLCFALLGSFFGGRAGPQWRSTWREAHRALMCVYNAGRRFIEYVGFGGFLKHVEDDIRDARELDRAPGGPSPQPVVKPGTFPFEDRYRIESNLVGGGSTAHLFVVRRLQRDRPVGDRLVLKYFDMGLGSRLEEVMRESRGMQVAREMGIVLDHELGPDHFYYTMPYYEGETLTRAAARIHRRMLSGQGMEKEDIETCLGWVSEILRILDAYHRRGVIHKDVKPDNLIVTNEGIRLVDLGLLTPVESALTLTTHGTEYFRDPEMVKLAVAGKRVRDVDAARFDIYSTGAVTYLLLEGSFPACGPLSRFSRPVPMALSTITSRAMAEGDKRYPSIAAMRADLDAYREMLRNQNPEDIPVSAMPSFSGFETAGAGADVVPPPPPMPAPPVRDEPVREERLSPRARLREFEASSPRRRVRWALILVGALACLAGLAFFVFEHYGNLARHEAAAARRNEASTTPEANLPSVSQSVLPSVDGEKVADHVRSAIAAGDTPIIIASEMASKYSRAAAALVMDTRRVLLERGAYIHPDEALAGELERWLVSGGLGHDVTRWLQARIGSVPACVLWFGDDGRGWRVRIYFHGQMRSLYGPVSSALLLIAPPRVLNGGIVADLIVRFVGPIRETRRKQGGATQEPWPSVLLVVKGDAAFEPLYREVCEKLTRAQLSLHPSATLAALVAAFRYEPETSRNRFSPPRIRGDSRSDQQIEYDTQLWSLVAGEAGEEAPPCVVTLEYARGMLTTRVLWHGLSDCEHKSGALPVAEEEGR
jgi:serine/threonine protein kinase